MRRAAGSSYSRQRRPQGARDFRGKGCSCVRSCWIHDAKAYTAPTNEVFAKWDLASVRVVCDIVCR